jgi:hypothetical protein
MSTVSTVLVSALVSGGVAIGFQVVAMPRLGARNERILTDFRNRRQFESNLLRLRVTCGMWANYEYPPDPSDEVREKIDAERERQLQRMDEVSKDLVDDLGFYALTYLGMNLPKLDTNTPTLISRYVFTVRRAMLSSRTPEAKATIVYELTEPMHNFLFGGRWHPVKRAKAPLTLLEVLGKYESPDDPELTGTDGEDAGPALPA